MNAEEKKAAEEAAAKIKEAVDSRNNDRIALMNAIADNSEEARADDFEQAPDETEEKAAKEDEEAHRYARALQEEGAESHESDDAVTDTRVTNGETYYRQVINGREVWQTLKQIRETAQKVASAEEYLRTASETARNAARLALPQKDEPVNLQREEIRKLLAEVALGNEEAADQLASFMARPSEVTPDVLQKIDQRMSFRTELARLEDKSEDLLKDPYMGRLFRSRLNELREQEPTMNLSEAYTSIDSELRSAFPGFKTDRIKDKLERKRSLPTPPQAAARQQQVVEEESEEDVGNVIEKMAKARGLSPHVHSRR